MLNTDVECGKYRIDIMLRKECIGAEESFSRYKYGGNPRSIDLTHDQAMHHGLGIPNDMVTRIYIYKSSQACQSGVVYF